MFYAENISCVSILGGKLLMRHLVDMSRYRLILCVLLFSFLFLPIATAKHVIVIYDVSASMVNLGRGVNKKVFMESEDIQRVNNYLTGILFTSTSQALQDTNDSYIKDCVSEYIGKPLYQSGDIITYAKYAKRRTIEINRAKLSRDEFENKLPNPEKPKYAFPGMVSYLLRAETEVYNELYKASDGGTYWVFVTDGDIDNSGKSDKEIDSILQQLAKIEDNFYSPMIFGLLVNKHVKIEIRRLQERQDIDAIFVAKPKKPKDPVQKIQCSRDNDGQFNSETLTVYTKNTVKSKFKLKNVNVEIVDEFYKPVQIENAKGTENLTVSSVPLNDQPPPYNFRITLPSRPEVATPGNKLSLEVTYNYNGVDKIYSPTPIDYTAAIDSIYVSTVENPDQQVENVTLEYSDGVYRGDMVIQSESPNKNAFKVDDVRGEIQYKDDRKLSDITLLATVDNLGEPLQIEVPKNDRLEWYGNKLVLEIDYIYDGHAKSETFAMSIEPKGGGSSFPMWILWVLFLLVAGIIGYFIVRGLISPPPPLNISVTEVNEQGTPLQQTKYFDLKNKTTLEFGPQGPVDLQYDVGSKAFLYCEKKSILFFEDPDADDAQVLDFPVTLTINLDEETTVYVRCEFVENSVEIQPEEEYDILGESTSDDRDEIDI